MVMICNKLGIPSCPPKFVKLKNLDRDAEYKERGTGKIYRGEFLETVGLTYMANADFNSFMYVFDKI